ncbi:DUF1428 family protein [Notoacmeibacter sp. MSK16QG-6]|uniref:DUF1428 domain-containing protein n=1 Tax=Notoacmeibacter sp. MSK16QG-6 TaxID=2957982 RepID=UPI0020A0E7FA|nr:DUF1428 domain-containing protein [Notoacmeibacter sp. MSK16QG-6]
MPYIDGFVAPVPTKNKDAYLQEARKAAEIFRKHGAIEVVECWEDNVPEGETTSFTLATKRQDDESVIFSWIKWPDKTTRDAAWKTMMEDPSMQPNEMPFDGKRMFWGGFQPILEA